jgi:phosphoribosylformylglycinamidine cyclo-ligase
VFAWLQREGNVADAEMWRTFNCGIGFVLVVAAEAADAVAAELSTLDLQHWRIGDVAAHGAGDRVVFAR